MNTPRYREEVNNILARLADEEQQRQEQKTTTPEAAVSDGIQDIYVLIVKENPDLEDAQVIDSVAEVVPDTTIPQASDLEPLQTPLLHRKESTRLAQGIISLYLFLILACLMFQFSMLLHPLTVTVTLVAKSQQVSLTGTLQQGRVLTPITLSQSSTVPTTGKGHQDAKQATGSLTFYNGQSNQVTVPAGTTLTGNSGEQIVTDADATIPPANQTIPPTFGQTTVSAHTKDPGTRGNIATGDINQRCCATSILVQNTAPFYGGQDERDYQTVTKSDIANAAAPLKADLAASLRGALQGQLKQGEQLQSLPCNPTVTPDHQIGQEATTVKVTVSEMCSGIAYNDQELTNKVTQLLTAQATKKLGSGYSLLDNAEVSITQATAQNTEVVLSFKAQSTWIYALTIQEQRYIKQIIAGKYKQNALQRLYRLPGIESVSLQFSGFGDATRIPKDISHIHLLIFYAAA